MLPFPPSWAKPYGLGLLLLLCTPLLSWSQCDVNINVPDEHCGGENWPVSWSGSISCTDAVAYRLTVYFQGDDWSYDSETYDANTFTELLDLTGQISFDAFYIGGQLYWDFYADYGSGWDYITSKFTLVAPQPWVDVYYDCGGNVAILNPVDDFAPSFLDGATDYSVWEVFPTFADDHWMIAPVSPGNVTIIPYTYICPEEYQTIQFATLDEVQTCDEAFALASGVPEENFKFCGPVTATTGCPGVGDAGDKSQAWFKINSGEQSHLTFAGQLINDPIESGWNNGDSFVQVYVDGPAPGCDDLEPVACLSEFDSFELVVNDYTDILPNTDYYFNMFTVPTRVFNLVALSDDGETELLGCSNPAACNYQPEPIFEDCPVLGCTDNTACNYQSSAECDNGTCIYPTDLELHVYHDENFDGDNDYWDDALGGVGSVVVEQAGEVVFTIIPNAEGEAVIPDMPDGDYTAYFEDASGLWTSNGTVNFTFPTCNEVEVGANPTPDTYDHYSSFFGQNSTTINCNDGLNLGFWALNIGAEPIDGSVTITFNENLIASPLGENWDDVSTTSATWNINNQSPGEQVTYGLHFEGPSVDLIAQELEVTIAVTLTEQNGTVFYEESYATTLTVVCAYDPNDKTLMAPATYTDAGYIDPQTETVSYRIRFQNTGNAPAQDVVIEDPIDPEKLDITSLAPTYGTHPFYTVLEPDGRAKFVFENIFLPDSVADLEGSQGEVHFNIDLLPGVGPGDVVENTAEIYFDSNPPIVTNTTSNALFDCAWMEASVLEVYCPLNAELTPSLSLADSYSWEWEGAPAGEPNTPLHLENLEVGTNEVTLLLTNPFCTSLPEVVLFEVFSNYPGDLDQNGSVSVDDVLDVLGDYGCTFGCTYDVTGDDAVSADDILLVLAYVGVSCD